jgi:NTP pyrophosphatase (non-canonical NTP hydrolase)
MLGLLFDLVRDFDNDRTPVFMIRRIGKTTEELGELWQAFLDVTDIKASREDDKNLHRGPKGKGWVDVREEIADLVICALDLAATKLPIDEGKTREEIEAEVLEMVQLKLDKWAKSKDL